MICGVHKRTYGKVRAERWKIVKQVREEVEMGEKVARSSKAKTKPKQRWQIAMAGLRDMVDQVIREKELERKRLIEEKRT